MSLISLRGIQLGLGGPLLFKDLDLHINPGERIGLLGRNGAGKTTLMRLIMGELEPEEGDILRQQQLNVKRLIQDVPNVTGSVFEWVAKGALQHSEIIIAYHDILQKVEQNSDSTHLKKLEKIQHEMDHIQGWDLLNHIENMIQKMELNPLGKIEDLSAGLKRRVLLAQALLSEPDLLLLDEPTNHLDLPSILWIEEFLLRFEGSILFISHDRAFQRKMATRMIELDRAKCLTFTGTYDQFFILRQEHYDAEEKQQQLFDKRLAQEEQWIRKGIKARRTRNEGRVRSLEAMREEKSAQRKKQGQVKFKIQDAEQSGKKVIQIKKLNFDYGPEKPIVKDFNLLVERGDKIGIIGPNGAGKTTLIKLLLGQLEPHEGTVKHGTQLNIAYFDQLHRQLDPLKTVKENISGGSDMLDWQGGKKHVLGYLNNFLFPADRANTLVSILSGGEKNRLLLAKLFLQKSNVLVLDEPTNDLDTDTLDLLVDLLMEYEGTIIFVSHDRDFINRLATSVLVFEENGAKEYIGGYDDWLRQSEVLNKNSASSTSTTTNSSTPATQTLSDGERKELFNLPKQIERCEREQEKLHEKMADPDFYNQDQPKIDKVVNQLKKLENEGENLFERWEELETRS